MHRSFLWWGEYDEELVVDRIVVAPVARTVTVHRSEDSFEGAVEVSLGNARSF